MRQLSRKFDNKRGGLKNNLGQALKSNAGQATTELAIMGSIVIMLFAYLFSQGFIYNARQALEMYTFREALRQSRQQERGITLTVMRDVISPSFFTGLNRQRLQASASVDTNVWKVYIPDVAQDLPTKQLLQINEAMIRNNIFIEVPPTKVKVDTRGEAGEWQWINSAIREIDPQTPLNNPANRPKSSSEYTYRTETQETETQSITDKRLQSQDTIITGITFETADKIRQNYLNDDWHPAGSDEKITAVSVDAGTVPGNVELNLEERVLKSKRAVTPK